MKRLGQETLTTRLSKNSTRKYEIGMCRRAFKFPALVARNLSPQRWNNPVYSWRCSDTLRLLSRKWVSIFGWIRLLSNYLLHEALFYMHRGFFAQALEDSPGDPMGSKYSPSVLAAYSSATSFVGLIESLFHQHPQLTERMWFVFTHVFSCAVCSIFSTSDWITANLEMFRSYWDR